MNGLRLPWALAHLAQIGESVGERIPAFFLDFDGTLTQIVAHPDLTALPARTRDVLRLLARDHVVCLVSGRDLPDLRRKVGLAEVHYAGDHGHRIHGKAGSGLELEVGPGDRVELETASYELERRLHPIMGTVVETKGTSISVHYRQVASDKHDLVGQIVKEVADISPGLRLTGGKLVHELRPRLPWDKGRAMLWLLGQLRLRRDDVCPICLGDDLTDEDLFFAARDWGVNIVVGDADRDTRAEYRLANHEEAATLLEAFVVQDEAAQTP
ncbi:MAG: trehalose-phosphatase [Actinobacteria bacterium]|nr:trehalose-phosphatase [Actinomycetota bacterium]